MSKAQERLSQVQSHLASSEVDIPRGKESILRKSPDDIVVTCALRTPITRGGKGGFKDTAAPDLLVHTFKSLISSSGIDPSLVEDISVGNVLAPGSGATEFRAAALVAGFPETTALKSLNRQCSSGLQACVDIANAIRCGMIDIGVGAGVESMSSQYGPGAVSEFSELLDGHREAKNCKVPMGVLSEQMASDRKITREAQDAFAARSYQRAEAAQKAGKFRNEIVPMKVKWVDPKTDEEKELVVDKDDGIRSAMSVEGLAKIKAAFKEGGSIHAGNASQVSDGAAAVLLMKRSTAEKLGQKIVGKFVCSSVVGVKPLLMGIGPWKAIPVALEKAGIGKEEVDLWEINEAFASQCVWCVKELGLDESKVNPNGGAIAFGHPLGCTGARQVSTLFNELGRTGKKVGVTSMCVGTGMGMAAVWVKE
ncbi:MAG: hypothetical protein Q9206_007240 [Seirophora lacunosa]